MLYIDITYANRLGSYLRNFKQKSQYLWNSSCPVCGDSKSKSSKARLYIYRQQTGLFCKCHKCSYSTNIGNLIKYIDATLYSEYVLERYKGNAKPHNDHRKIEEAIPLLKTIKLDLLEDDILSKLKRIDKLAETHAAVKYVIKRKIPREFWNLLYYTPKFYKYVNENIKFQFPSLGGDHPRLVIPFFNEFGKCFALQGRAFGKEIPKYYTIKIDDIQEKIYGLERIDYSKPILITEGPIDSLFLPNALSVSGSSFDSPTIKKILTNATIVSDNEPRHKDIVKIIEKNINLGYSVCMFPETIKEKDINEMIQSGLTSEEIFEIISNNTFSGIEAKLKLSDWQKL